MRVTLSLLIISAVLLTACGPSAAPVPLPTTAEKPRPSDTTVPASSTPVPPTETPVPASDTPLPPSNTPLPPTATLEPSPTITPTLDIAALTAARPPGAYRVFTDISPGIWCPTEPNAECRWTVYYPGRNEFKFGVGRGCTPVSQVAEVVEWPEICGPFEFNKLESYMTPLEDLPLSREAQIAPRGEGEYLVGVHVAPGVWRVTGDRACRWAVFDVTSRSVHYGQGPSGTVNLKPPAHWVRISGSCEQMVYVSN